MRYINYSHLTRLVDLNELQQATEAILAIKSPAARKIYIKDNADKWSNIREYLWHLGCGKCWYSDDMIQVRETHIEHYRPKNQVHGTPALKNGYWWLAFDPENLMLSHPTSNIRREDYLKKIQCGKGCYFPLKDGSRRAQNPGEEVDEIPLLLNPTEAKDVKLITFDSSSGKPIANDNTISEDWDRERVNETVGYYHLDEGTWNMQRKSVFVEAKNIRKKLEKYDIGSDEYNEAIEQATDMLDGWTNFSSVAKHAFILNGILEIVA